MQSRTHQRTRQRAHQKTRQKTRHQRTRQRTHQKLANSVHLPSESNLVQLPSKVQLQVCIGTNPVKVKPESCPQG